MTVARSDLVDVEVTRFYHCISRRVRRAFLCGEGFEHRKQWIEDRLELLACCFAMSVCGFAVMDNHLHDLVRLDAQDAKNWSEKEVVRRSIRVYPPRFLYRAFRRPVNERDWPLSNLYVSMLDAWGRPLSISRTARVRCLACLREPFGSSRGVHPVDLIHVETQAMRHRQTGRATSW